MTTTGTRCLSRSPRSRPARRSTARSRARCGRDLGLTRLAGGLLFDLTFDVTIVGPCQRCLEDARELVEVRAREYQADIAEVEDEETTPYLEGELLDVDRWATTAPSSRCRS